jgi:adenylate cyclase
MPEIDGIEACRRVKAEPALTDVPIIMVTASTEPEDLQLAFDAGAIDYLTKPPSRVELRARVRSALRLKHEMDRRKAREQELLDVTKQLEQAMLDSERLLLNVLPRPVAERLKRHNGVIADSFPEVTVLFADLVDFTTLSARISPAEVVALLNDVFSSFDRLAEKHGLEKIKTIGDAYMAVGGLPTPRDDHAEAVAEMALDMQQSLLEHGDAGLQLRIGIHTGPVVAGVIGTSKFSYDLWGDTVNIASRMESHGLVGTIQVTPETYARLSHGYQFAERGAVRVKGKGEISTYLLMGRQLALRGA